MTTAELLRQQRGVSLRELSRAIGIAHQHLHAFEQGLRPWPSARRKLAAYYNVSEDAL